MKKIEAIQGMFVLAALASTAHCGVGETELLAKADSAEVLQTNMNETHTSSQANVADLQTHARGRNTADTVPYITATVRHYFDWYMGRKEARKGDDIFGFRVPTGCTYESARLDPAGAGNFAHGARIYPPSDPTAASNSVTVHWWFNPYEYEEYTLQVFLDCAEAVFPAIPRVSKGIPGAFFDDTKPPRGHEKWLLGSSGTTPNIHSLMQL